MSAANTRVQPPAMQREKLSCDNCERLVKENGARNLDAISSQSIFEQRGSLARLGFSSLETNIGCDEEERFALPARRAFDRGKAYGPRVGPSLKRWGRVEHGERALRAACFRPCSGGDCGSNLNPDGGGVIGEYRVDQLIRQKGAAENGTIGVRFLDPGVPALPFTFGQLCSGMRSSNPESSSSA
jgi:hypothetical protein